jgi:hypothetical protein
LDDVRMRQFRKVTELPHFFIYPLHFLIRCSSLQGFRQRAPVFPAGYLSVYYQCPP